MNPPDEPKTPTVSVPIPTERYVRLLVVTSVALLLLLSAYLTTRVLALIHHTVLLFALGGLTAYALDPIVEIVRGNISLKRRPSNAPPLKKRPRWLGVVAVFAVLFGALGTGTYLLGREAVHQATVLSRDKEQIQTNIRAELVRTDTWLASRGIPLSVTQIVDDPPPNVRAWGEEVAKRSLTIATDASKFLVEGIIVLLIAVYFLLFSEEMRAASLRALPERLRPYANQWQNDVNRILGGFVRGQAVLALVLGAAAGAACGLLGLRFWLLIGVFVTFASLVPVIGPYIGALPAIISALLTQTGILHTVPGVRVALVVLVFFVINEAGSKVLYPRLVGRALGLHEVLVLFALLAGFEIGGITGVLFAAPLTALAAVTVAQLWRLWTHEPPVNVAAVAAVSGAEAKAEGVP